MGLPEGRPEKLVDLYESPDCVSSLDSLQSYDTETYERGPIQINNSNKDQTHKYE